MNKQYRPSSTLNQSILGDRRFWAHLLLVLILFGPPHLAYADTSQEASLPVYRTANFQVNYRTGNDPGACEPNDGDFEAWSAEAQAAMNLVVDILDDLLNSAVPIVIDACFQRVDPEGGTLAFAGATDNLTQAEVPALPVAGRTYPIALANAIAGVDQNGAGVEIIATANAEVAWDYCTVGCTVAADRGEQIAAMLPVATGSQLVQFDIPSGAAEGVVYNARIRLVPDWNGDGFCDDQVALSPSGGVFGGEVEDYQWPLGAIPGEPAPTPQTLLLTLVIR
jgi:hypothetical protein